ncbi:MspA family porin [Nocardia miyunensis]|uniref:MspA family porin n=1 Tax=Nocardia miyunensis TaxID=282684 RepID=UPI0008321E88|nr:MspA family porin [Nocardia miyunensis]
MNTFRMGLLARTAGIGLAAAAAFGYFSVGAANADTFVPLPGGHITRTIGDGTVVNVDITGESANINPSLQGTPLSRNAWTSGHAEVNLTGGEAKDPKTATRLIVGYIVGCQVDLSGGIEPGVNASGDADLSTSPATVSATGGASTTLTIAAGQAKVLNLLDVEAPDDFGADSHNNFQQVKGPHQSVTWHNETFAVDGCGGYAQARSFAQAKVYTNSSIGYVTVWGKPFSIG